MLFYICVLSAILASFLAAGITDEEMTKFNDDLMVVRNKCMEELKLPGKDLQKAQVKDLMENEPCVAACVLKAKGAIDDKGMFNETATYAVAEKFVKSSDDLENIKKMGKICSSVNEEKVGDGDAGCERAMLLLICVANNLDLIKM